MKYYDYYTKAKIDLSAIKQNVVEIKKLLKPGIKFMAVVKADAYGHGAVEVGRALEVDYLSVATLNEALELKEAGIKSPVLILSEGRAAGAEEVVHSDFIQTVYTFELAQALSKQAQKQKKKARIHIKVDTGMGRIGVPVDGAVNLFKKISSLDNLIIEGIFTHFAKAEDTRDEFTHQQFQKFQRVLSAIDFRGLKHAANSAATLFYPETHLDMIRVGLAMYGLYPPKAERHPINLKPALEFLSRVVYLKKVPAGTPLSYGCTYVTQKETQIATIPVGYADGLSRTLSNRGAVLIKGKRFPIVGRISMDLTLVDVGEAEIEVGDEVTLIGFQGKEVISADEVADLLGTISYEVVCGIGKRVPRVYP